MDPIRVGVIGLKFGQYHVKTLATMDGVCLVAVADNAPDFPGGLDAYAASYGARPYSDGLEMLHQEELDAILISVSPRWRPSLMEEAARMNIPMFIEKPWASNLDHAHKLAAICHRYDATVMTGFSFRFHPAIVYLKELMDSTLGTGYLLDGAYLFNWLPPADFWLWDPENGNGFFNENSCHLFDAVCYLMGKPVSLFAEVSNFNNSPGPEVAAVTLRFGNGATAALTVGGLGTSAFHAFPRIDLVTANGQAHLSGREHIWESLTWASRDESVTHQLIAPPETLGRTRYSDALEHFFDCIRHKQKPNATIEDGIQAVEVAMAINESVRTGQRVSLQTGNKK